MKANNIGLILLICALGSIFSMFSDVFLSLDNLSNILLASATLGILAFGAAFILGSGGLDLSIGSIMAFSAVGSVALINMYEFHWGVALAFCLIIGCAVGVINGALIAHLKLPAFIVTLGMLSVVRGLSYITTDGRPIYGLPEGITAIGQGNLCGIPTPIFIFIVLAMLLHVLLRHTAFGLHTLMMGDNEIAVRNAGIKIKRHKIILYGLSGLTAAIAGLLYMGRVNAADPSAGIMIELTAITAVIIGGTSLFGGKASVIGAFLGALLMGVLQNGLTLLAVPAYYQQLVIGALLIASVALMKMRKM